MRKEILLSALCMTAAMASAAPLTPSAALGRFAVSQGPAKVRSLRSETPELRFTRSVDGVPALYVFAARQGGFMVLSADDTTVPLLGFSDTGTLPADEAELPDGMRYWLGSLAEQVAYNAGHAPQAGTTLSVRRADATRADIAPMITTKWDQNSPYNDKCPSVGDRRCVTGCVATAMSQVMNYYKYPANVQDSHSYTWKNGGSSLTLGISPSIKFDWNNMLDVYDENSPQSARDAVATLMSACGISVDMNYSPVASGALTTAVCRAFVESFGYDPGLKYMMRDYYSIPEWEDVVYENLRQYGPVYYDGQSNTGGHAFVCDGYSDGYFHFNWGWGGMSDGYYLLTALDPGSQGIGGHTSGYNFGQAIVAGLTKEHVTTDAKGGQLLWRGGFSINESSASLGSEISFTGTFYNYDYRTIRNWYVGLLVSDDKGYSEFLSYQNSLADLPLNYGFTDVTWPVNLPSSMPAGIYSVQPAYKVGDEDAQPILVEKCEVGSYIMAVEGKTATFRSVNPAYAWAEDFRLDGKIYEGLKFRCTATVTNTDESEPFAGSVIAALVKDNQIVAFGDKAFISLDSRESRQFDYVSTFSYPVDDNGSEMIPAPGEYDMALFQVLNNTYRYMSDPIKVTLNGKTTSVIAVSNLSVPDKQNPDKVTATADIHCTSGYFGGSFRLYVFEDDGQYAILGCDSGFIGVEAGNSATATWTFAIPDASSGKTYFAAVYDTANDEWLTEPAYFNVSSPTGIASSVGDDSEVVERSYISVSGIDLGVEKPAPGLYILREVRVDGTVSARKVTVR